MFKCTDRPGGLSLSPSLSTMYRVGCMTGCLSWGGWFRVLNGKTYWSPTRRSARRTTPGWRARSWAGRPRRSTRTWSRTYGGQ
jgi:hypothetical protein